MNTQRQGPILINLYYTNILYYTLYHQKKIQKYKLCKRSFFKAIRASTSVLIWTLIMMLLVNSLVALVVSSFLDNFIRDQSRDWDERVEIFLDWGSYSRAVETMFEITLANWGPPVRRLMNKVDEWWALFFLAYKLTIGFAVVQVIISTFIQQTFKVASRDEEVMIREKYANVDAMKKNVQKLFAYLDESGDGMITKEEFLNVLEDDRIRTWFGSLEVDVSEAEEIFDLLDKGDGSVNQEEFLNGLQALKGGAKATDIMRLNAELRKNGGMLKAMSQQVELLQRSLRSGEAAGGRRPHGLKIRTEEAPGVSAWVPTSWQEPDSPMPPSQQGLQLR